MYLYAHTERMVALAALSTGQETAFSTKAKTPTHHTHILQQRNTSGFIIPYRSSEAKKSF